MWNKEYVCSMYYISDMRMWLQGDFNGLSWSNKIITQKLWERGQEDRQKYSLGLGLKKALENWKSNNIFDTGIVQWCA